MIKTAQYTDKGGRPCNEDSVAVIRHDDNSVLAILCDGLGGQGGGDVASGIAVRTFETGWDGTADIEKLKLLAAEANEKILERQTAQCRMMSTLALAAVCGDKATVIHTGDSRIYHFYNSKIQFQSTDQSVPQISVMMGEITADQIRFHPNRNQIIHALGEETGPSLVCNEFTLEHGKHSFLLCSDGFWEYVLEDQMERSLNRSLSPGKWLSSMKKTMSINPSRGADCDNNSAAVIWVKI